MLSVNDNETIDFSISECSLGLILIAVNQRGVCAILLGGDARVMMQNLQASFPASSLKKSEGQCDHWVSKIVHFVETPGAEIQLALDIKGTAFQQRVWAALRDVPVGSTVSYTEIAKRIQAPKSARAVARACTHNKLAVLIPCHRVVRQDGSLSGYRWGVARKQALLERERLVLYPTHVKNVRLTQLSVCPST